MLAVPNVSLLSIPVFSFSTITKKIAKEMGKKLEASIKEFRDMNDALYTLAYKKDTVLSENEMKELEKLDDLLLLYSDFLADFIDDDTNRAASVYNYLDELYTLTLKITTSISYIRSKNRQLHNAA